MNNIENYILIRHKLFFINEGNDEYHHPKQLKQWKKSTLVEDLGEGAYEKVKVIKDPKMLSEEVKDLYIKYLELKVYKPHQLHR